MILITGGTGAVGAHLSAAVAGRADVRALARSDQSEAKLHDLGVETVVRGDLARPETLGPAFEGVERLFLLTPYSPEQEAEESNALDAAQAAGVRRVVKLSVEGADVEPTIALARAHQAIERRLASSHFDVTLLRPTSFSSNLLGQLALIAQGQLVFPVGQAEIAHVDPRDIAAVAAEALTRDTVLEETLHLTGPDALTYTQVAERISTATGREVRYVDVPLEDWRQGLRAAGVPDHYVDGLGELMQLYVARGQAPVSDDVERVVGRRARSLDEFVRETLGPALATPASA